MGRRSKKKYIRRRGFSLILTFSIIVITSYSIHYTKLYDEKREDYKETFTRVQDVIKMQKFENAAVGLLNPNFIGKDIGLVDKKDLSSTDGTMTPKPTVVVQDNKTAEEVNKLMGGK